LETDRTEFPGFEEAMESGEITPGILNELSRRVAMNQLAMEMLDRGAALSGCNYDLALRHGIQGVVPKLNRSRRLALEAAARTRLLAFPGCVSGQGRLCDSSL
jgi:hypothetical protein